MKVIRMTVSRKGSYSSDQQDEFLNTLVYNKVVNNIEKKGESESNKDGERWMIFTYEMAVDEDMVQWIKYLIDSIKPYLNFTAEIEA